MEMSFALNNQNYWSISVKNTNFIEHAYHKNISKLEVGVIIFEVLAENEILIYKSRPQGTQK